MKVLLIGGSGTLSSDTTRLCIKKDYEVYLFNRGNRNIFKSGNIHYLIGDINDLKKAKEIIGGLQFDVVIDYLTFTVDTLKSRINLFNGHCKQYIFISSATVFKNTNKILNENSPKGNTGWSYAQNKYLCERYLNEHKEEFDFSFTIVRPYITYDDRRIPFPVITKKSYWTLIDRIKKDKCIIICDDGNAKLTLTHTLDFAIGIVGLFLNDQAYNNDFNIVGDTVGTWNDILHIVERYIGKKAKVIYVPSEILGKDFTTQKAELMCDKRHSHIFDNTKIKKAVPEFKTSWNLHDGLYHTLNYLNDTPELQKIDKYWNNTIDVLSSKYSKDLGENVSVKQKLIYLLQEHKYLRQIGRVARKFKIWRF